MRLCKKSSRVVYQTSLPLTLSLVVGSLWYLRLLMVAARLLWCMWYVIIRHYTPLTKLEIAGFTRDPTPPNLRWTHLNSNILLFLVRA
jgi:hypothetical protein